MAANKNWPRWIFASMAKNFKDNCSDLSFFMEGEDQKTANLSDYIEFRMNGPLLTEYSRDYWKVEAVVNILVVSKQNQSSIHTIHQNVGTVTAAFGKSISIYKYGNGIDDDQSFLGCMQIYAQNGQEIDVAHIGQVNPEVKEMQSMVQAYYCMKLEV